MKPQVAKGYIIKVLKNRERDGDRDDEIEKLRQNK